MSKVPVNYDQLCGLADHARRVGTLDAFADVALQWAGQADKEIERLRQWEIVGREWLDKTDWMQSKDAPVRWLGKHRADALRDEIERLTAERDELRDVLLRSGFVPCDIPACNCGSWHHRYGLPERMQEIKDALAEAGHELSNANGNLPINALKALVAERDDHARWRADLADKLHDRETTISAAWEALRSAGVHSEATIDDGIRLLRRQLDEARAEREAMANVLPGHYYMDPPDGGDVPVLEQLRRMATDAERYRDWLRGGANIPPESTRWARWDVRYWDGRHWNTLFAEQMDAAIDAAMGASNE